MAATVEQARGEKEYQGEPEMLPMGSWVMIAFMLFVFVTAAGLLIWGWRSGQFRDVEEPARRMLEDREPEPWPGREQEGEKGDKKGDR